MERFWLSVFAKGQLNNISTDILSNEKVFVIGLCAGSIKTIATYKVPTIVHCAEPIKFEQQALQQPQLGAGRLLETNTNKVVGTAMSQNPAKTQIRVFDRTHVNPEDMAGKNIESKKRNRKRSKSKIKETV